VLDIHRLMLIASGNILGLLECGLRFFGELA